MTVFKDQITIGTKVFNNNVADANGCKAYIDTFVGWDDTANVNIQSTEFGYSDGVEVANRAPLSARFIEVGGWMTGPTRLAIEQSIVLLKTALKADLDLLTIRASAIPQQATCKRASNINYPQDFRAGSDVASVRWATTLIMPWPFKLDPTLFSGNAAPYAGGEYYRLYVTGAGPTYYRTYDSAGHWRTYALENADIGSSRPQSVVFINTGDADAYPVMRVQGPLLAGTWYLLHEESGDQLGFDADISTGQELVIDMRNHTADLSGIAVDYFLDGDWLKAPPGTNTYRLISGTSDDNAGFVLEARSTWE